ncbi:MAG TPA: hypothetical protein VGM41_03945 [Chitinophagaceae bacterium]|jgi:hypothetical protein
MNSLAIAIVHPAYEHLKRLGRFLHFIAGLLIVLNAIHLSQQPHPNQLYFWCQLIIGADILIMVIISRNLSQELPKINMVFRFIECLIFLGASLAVLLEKNWFLGAMLLVISGAYGYLLYCERKVAHVEMVAFHHIGITISGIPSSRFFLWSNINQVEARYDSIIIETSRGKTFHFNLRRNLQFDELDQIHEFCRHYLGNDVR